MAEFPFTPPSSSPAETLPPENAWLRSAIVASWREILIVLAVVVGPFAFRSTAAALDDSARRYISILMSDSTLLPNCAIESALLGAFLFYLRWRGWKPSDFRLHPGWLSSLEGFFLMVVVFVANGLTVISLMVAVYAMQTQYHTFLEFVQANVPNVAAVHLSWFVLVGAMIINALLEEVVCMGYAFNQLAAKHGPLFALLLTVLLRMSCHTYQGPIHVLGVGMVFLLFGVVYWKTKNLWPLVLAHASMDTVSGSVVKLMHPHP